MGLKYYLRGAGIALILAVLLTNVSHKNEVSAYADTSKQNETEMDAMVGKDNLTLADASKIENSYETVETECVVESEEVELNVETTYIAETQSVEEQQKLDLDEDVIQEKKEETNFADESAVAEPLTGEMQEQPTNVLIIEEGAQETFLLNIARGDDSGTVSRKLYNAGLIDSASQFDAYLMQHGYDKKIKVGTVEVPIGSTWLEIAEKLAGK